MSPGLEHHPDCERTGDSCLICEACAIEVSQLTGPLGDWGSSMLRNPIHWLPDADHSNMTACGLNTDKVNVSWSRHRPSVMGSAPTCKACAEKESR